MYNPLGEESMRGTLLIRCVLAMALSGALRAALLWTRWVSFETENMAWIDKAMPILASALRVAGKE